MTNIFEWLIKQHCEREGLGWAARCCVLHRHAIQDYQGRCEGAKDVAIKSQKSKGSICR